MNPLIVGLFIINPCIILGQIPQEIYHALLFLDYEKTDSLIDLSRIDVELKENLSLLSEELYNGGQATSRPIEPKRTSDIADCLAELIVGYRALYSSNNKSKSLEHLLKVYELSGAFEFKELRKLSLLSILEYFSFESYTSFKNYEKYLTEFDQISSSTIEKAWAEYYRIYFNDGELFLGETKDTDDRISFDNIVKELPNNTKFHTLYYATKALEHEINNENDKAIKLYNLALSKSKNYPHLKYIAFRSCLKLSKIFEERRDYNTGLNFADQAVQFIDRSDSLSSLYMISSFSSRLYLGAGDYQEAYTQLRRSVVYQAQMNVRENIIKSSALETQLRTAQKEKDLLQQKLQTEKLRIQQKQLNITVISLGGLLTLSILGFYGFRRITKLKQSNLQQQIKETEQQGQLTAINAQLDGEEQERKRVAATLHDGIASHLTAASFHLQTLTQQNDSTQAADKAAKLIIEASERTRKLSHELYPPVLIKDGLVSALNALISSYNHKELSFHLESGHLTTALHPDQETKIYYMAVELLQNVIKHSKASTCHIHISNEGNILTLNFLDDGIGIKQDETSLGLGLNSIRARLVNMSGTLNINKNSPQGTKVIITVPLT